MDTAVKTGIPVPHVNTACQRRDSVSGIVPVPIIKIDRETFLQSRELSGKTSPGSGGAPEQAA